MRVCDVIYKIFFIYYLISLMCVLDTAVSGPAGGVEGTKASSPSKFGVRVFSIVCEI